MFTEQQQGTKIYAREWGDTREMNFMYFRNWKSNKKREKKVINMLRQK